MKTPTIRILMLDNSDAFFIIKYAFALWSAELNFQEPLSIYSEIHIMIMILDINLLMSHSLVNSIKMFI